LLLNYFRALERRRPSLDSSRPPGELLLASSLLTSSLLTSSQAFLGLNADLPESFLSLLLFSLLLFSLLLRPSFDSTPISWRARGCPSPALSPRCCRSVRSTRRSGSRPDRTSTTLAISEGGSEARRPGRSSGRGSGGCPTREAWWWSTSRLCDCLGTGSRARSAASSASTAAGAASRAARCGYIAGGNPHSNHAGGGRRGARCWLLYRTSQLVSRR